MLEHDGRSCAIGSKSSIDDLEQQHEAASLGMWVFLATEVMFFGTLFLGLGVYRYLYAEAFEKASEQAELDDRRHQHHRAAGQQLDDGAGGPLRQARPAQAAADLPGA